MIVDLLRNDLGRVCEYGSVRVEKLCDLEEHPTLFHLVSTVEGTLQVGAKFADILGALFPCGSITGSAKAQHDADNRPAGANPARPLDGSDRILHSRKRIRPACARLRPQRRDTNNGSPRPSRHIQRRRRHHHRQQPRSGIRRVTSKSQSTSQCYICRCSFPIRTGNLSRKIFLELRTQVYKPLRRKYTNVDTSRSY